MGLWDTVLSNNWSRHTYKLAMPDAFAYVVQAVALNEYRAHTLPLGRTNPLDHHSWGSFPLESIMSASIPATQTRIEKGLIGAHAGIGGGFSEDQSELARVALLWMVKQAEDAGVNMLTPPNTIIANPIIHDKSDAIRFGSPKDGSALVNDKDWGVETPNPLI